MNTEINSMTKEKIEQKIYEYLEQYSDEYYPISKIDIEIVDNLDAWARFDAHTLYEGKRILKIDPDLFNQNENFIKETLYHEFTHLQDAFNFFTYNKESFKRLMMIYSEVHATEIEMDITLSTKVENNIISFEEMDLSYYMNLSLRCMENQFIYKCNKITFDTMKFSYKQLYYFIGKLISLKKHDITYTYEFSDELPIVFSSLFEEIIKYFLKHKKYNYKTLLKYQCKMEDTIKSYIRTYNGDSKPIKNKNLFDKIFGILK